MKPYTRFSLARINQIYFCGKKLPHFLRSVLADNLVPKTWKKLSRNPKLPQDLITRCVESPDWEVRTQIAKNSNLTSDQISLLSHDTVVSVRTEIAKRTDLSKPVISQLSKDLL